MLEIGMTYNTFAGFCILLAQKQNTLVLLYPSVCLRMNFEQFCNNMQNMRNMAKMSDTQQQAQYEYAKYTQYAEYDKYD